MFSCFLLLLNDNSSAYFFQRLESWDLIAAMLFFFMFIVFMVFILLNFLIAIIVDAFMSVKDSNIVATSITSDLAHIFKYKWNCWRGRYLHYSFILERLVQLGAKDTRVEESDRRMRRMRSVQRRMRAMFCGDCGNNKPESSNSDSRVRRQHVLTVREKRIDAISLAMILQRRHDRERHEPHEHELLPTCWPKAASSETAEEEQLEQLSQAVMLQCGEVVKQSALPVKKPVQKLSLAHIKEDLARSEAAVKELRGMLALVLDHLARTHPLEDAAHAMGAPADPSAGSSMRRCHTEPAPLSDLLTDSPQPLEPAASRREVPRRYETFQPFPRGETETTVALDIPDGDWVVVLNAPAGGIRGTVHAPPPGTRRFSVVGAASTIELAAWGYCALDDGTVAANQTGPSGGAAGASPDICRDTCEKLVVCLPATCGRAFTERSWTVRACASSHLLPSPPMPTLPAPGASLPPCSSRCPIQRLTVLQVAVSRALFTVAKDRCLAGHGPGASRKHSQGGPGSLCWHMVACFCTMLGGPVMTMDECRLKDTEGQQVLSISDMHAYLQSTHVRGGRVISAQHMRRFVLTVGAALSSVTLISDAAAACLNSLMHSFDDAIVTSDAVGCSQGVTHNTTIHVGDKVTWVWDDDLPHSLKVAAMGEADDPLFLGFGGHRLGVSRKMACTHMNVGQGDTLDEPQP
ncbi:unnamed protein product, partial [Closterium sp. NIES-64]